ncbi:hypothetical protein B0H10DRAFT_1845888 [Mycena sp. CBHHK59/15]|nr:hypothetical protein B0H10DRAFT_1845888 [Mycena sp. CBHHK59/15]
MISNRTCRLYYQFSPDRLSACPLTIHALLHIADGIEAAGPVWAYWVFPMERFCSRLQPCIKSRRFPFASIDAHVVATAQLDIIKTTHGLGDALRLGPPKIFMITDPTCILLPPHRISTPLSPGLARKISVSLSTRFDVNLPTINKYFNAENVDQWAKVQRLDDGDRMLASSMLTASEDRRDATYVRVCIFFMCSVSEIGLTPTQYFQPKTFYGQLQHIFVVKIPRAWELQLTEETTLILVAIRTCEVNTHNDLDMHYYQKDGRLEVVDMTSVQCLVGRFKTTNGKHWVIVDRSGNLARPYYDGED